MRLFIVLLVFLYGCNNSMKVEYTFLSPNPSEAHLSANTFAAMVGEKLKQRYPSKVINLNVIVTKDGDNFQFHWECEIIQTSIDSAQYYFDRRGTFLSARSKDKAFDLVEQELIQSKKVQQMIEKFKDIYGNYSLPYQYIITVYTQDKNQYWCLREFFCTAPK
jgi:hypothetical protein